MNHVHVLIKINDFVNMDRTVFYPLYIVEHLDWVADNFNVRKKKFIQLKILANEHRCTAERVSAEP